MYSKEIVILIICVSLTRCLPNYRSNESSYHRKKYEGSYHVEGNFNEGRNDNLMYNEGRNSREGRNNYEGEAEGHGKSNNKRYDHKNSYIDEGYKKHYSNNDQKHIRYEGITKVEK